VWSWLPEAMFEISNVEEPEHRVLTRRDLEISPNFTTIAFVPRCHSE
jgi:hypothetical protein